MEEMSEPISEAIILAAPEPNEVEEVKKPYDPLDRAAAELAAREAFVEVEVAQSCFRPVPPPGTWAGRDEVIDMVAKGFSISELEAAQSVDAFVIRGFGPSPDNSKIMAKRLMRIRLTQIRALALKGIADGRIEKQWKIEQDGDTKAWVRRLFKEKKYYGIEPVLLSRLIEIENAIARLDGLDGTDEDDGTFSILEEIDEKMASGARRKLSMSLAQKIKHGKIKNLSPESMKKVGAALDEMKGAKPVDLVEQRGEEDDE